MDDADPLSVSCAVGCFLLRASIAVVGDFLSGEVSDKVFCGFVVAGGVLAIGQGHPPYRQTCAGGACATMVDSLWTEDHPSSLPCRVSRYSPMAPQPFESQLHFCHLLADALPERKSILDAP